MPTPSEQPDLPVFSLEEIQEGDSNPIFDGRLITGDKVEEALTDLPIFEDWELEHEIDSLSGNPTPALPNLSINTPANALPAVEKSPDVILNDFSIIPQTNFVGLDEKMRFVDKNFLEIFEGLDKKTQLQIINEHPEHSLTSLIMLHRHNGEFLIDFREDVTLDSLVNLAKILDTKSNPQSTPLLKELSRQNRILVLLHEASDNLDECFVYISRDMHTGKVLISATNTSELNFNQKILAASLLKTDFS